MKVSIIIPTYEMHGNGASFLRESFNILKNQTHKNFEIIITDHSSNDEVKNLCKSWASDLEINYHKNAENVGNSSANINNALKHASGDIVKLLFQDDFLWSKDSLLEIVNEFKKNPDKHWLTSSSEHSNDGKSFYRKFVPSFDMEELVAGVNTISSPSVISFLNKDVILFDENLIWLMDCDYYIMMYKKFGDPIILEPVNVVNRIWAKQYNNIIVQTKKDEEKEYFQKKLANKSHEPTIPRTLKYSVVMASFLGVYEHCASNRERKFIRAVNSFLAQDYKNKELIIVSDCCDITEKAYNENFSAHKNIIFKKLKTKMPHFSGAVRNEGLALASGDRVCYLDTDDFIGKNHISKINEQFTTDLSWVFSDDYIVSEFHSFNDFKKSIRVNTMQETKIGTSSICHSAKLNAVWPDGYGHDWFFIESLLSHKHAKIEGVSYNVCHIPRTVDV